MSKVSRVTSYSSDRMSIEQSPIHPDRPSTQFRAEQIEEMTQSSQSTVPEVWSSPSYRPDNRSGHYKAIAMKSIPWDENGAERLTVKLALWWLHMLAGAPGIAIHVDDDQNYQPLNCWLRLANGKFQNPSTAIALERLPCGSRIIESGTSTPPEQARSSPLSSPQSMPTPIEWK
ncbi:hypothetical protein FQN50_009976 [Emmonsiellopsis sp. PD_5]|nr:hypothetical protein FQN50_009976 [Emmonsiellopsis sp. PD_5]